MVINVMKFLGTVLLITLSTHYFLFFSWVRFYNINSNSAKTGLFAAMCFLSITFILASIFIHISNNAFTRVYYLFSGVWLGLMSFLLIITVFIWLIKGGLLILPGDFSSETPIRSLSIFLYAIAVIYTGFCHYQFYKIDTKSLTIPIRNLPATWEGKKIIHLSDLHLGGAKDVKFIKEVVSMTNSLSSDLILITGDLFDGAGDSQEKYITYLNNFRAKNGVIFTSGNHEIYSGVKKSRKLIEKSNIILLDNRAVVIDGLQILGISYPEFKNTISFDFDNPDLFAKNLPTILLYHTPTSIKTDGENLSDVKSSDYLAPDTTFAAAINNGISLQLSGHTHAGQFFPYTWIADRIFKGFHYGLHKIGNFYIYISSGTGSWGPPLRSHYLSEIAVITLTKAE